MGIGVGFFQALDRDVSVNLGRGKAGVTKQCLDAAKISAAIEQVGGKTVTEFVRTNRNWNRSVAQIAFQDQPDRARRNSFSRFINKERSGMRFCGGPIF